MDIDKTKITKGPVKWVRDTWRGGYAGLWNKDDDPILVPQHANDGDTGDAWFNTDGYAGEETLEEADAALIADAFNTFTRTGLTPSELAEQRKKMMEALEQLAENPYLCSESNAEFAQSALTKATEASKR